MLFNPIALLAALLAFLAVGFGGYRYGKHVCQGEHATEVANAQKQAIDSANAESYAATKLAVGQIAKEADARVRAAGIRRKGEIDAIAKARPECARDSESMGLLLRAVGIANDSTSAGDGVPDPVPATPATDQR